MLAVCQAFRIAWRQCLLRSLCPAFCTRFLHNFKEHAFFFGWKCFPALPSHYIHIVWIFFQIDGGVVCNIRHLFRSRKHVWVRQEIPTYTTRCRIRPIRHFLLMVKRLSPLRLLILKPLDYRMSELTRLVCESVDYVSFKTFMCKPKLMLIKVFMMCISTPFSDSSTAC